MRISVIDPIGEAFGWARRVCFNPFDLSKWLTIGFCAFLAGLGRGGAGGSFSFPNTGGPGGRGMGQSMQSAAEWISSNLPLILGIGLTLLAIGLAVAAVLQWLSSRGTFMFLDCVVRDEPAVVEPWGRLKPFGNSLFLVRFCLMLIGAVVVLGVLAGSAVLFWPDLAAGRFTERTLSAVLLAVLLLVPYGLIIAVIHVMLFDFVVPIMYRRGLPTMAAAGVLWRDILPGHIGVFIVYLLMKVVLSLAAGITVMTVTLVTCCLAGLPYISSVVFLPIAVFFRAYSLYFLGQFGPEYQLLVHPNLPPGAVPSPVD